MALHRGAAEVPRECTAGGARRRLGESSSAEALWVAPRGGAVGGAARRLDRGCHAEAQPCSRAEVRRDELRGGAARGAARKRSGG
jgi:hypothetical protein